MKTAIYVEDGTTQVVLTPESDFEKDVLSKFEYGAAKVNLFHGSFYDCRGGWVRQSHYSPSSAIYGEGVRDDRSLILRLRDREEEE